MNGKQRVVTAVAVISGLLALEALAQDRRPDLIVRDIRLDENCKILVTISNASANPVPDSAYSLSPPGSSGIQMYRNGQPWGGIVLGGFDAAKQTKPPGGSAQHPWFPNAANLKLTPGVHALKVTVDNNNAVKESNETNNTLERRVECRPRLPDLVVRDIRLNEQCQILVTLSNVGSGPVPNDAYSLSPPRTPIQMYKDGQPWGGIVLGGFDSAKQTQPPGGSAQHLWFPGAANLKLTPGTHTLKVDVDGSNHVAESNEGNNSLTRRVTCGRTPPTVPGGATPGRLAPGR
jgi:hypothetical protein